jgi:hypothetical protein
MDMQRFRVVAPLAVAAAAVIGLAAISPIAQSSADSGRGASYEAPIANAAGGEGPPPPLPSIVNVRVERANDALERAAAAVDAGDTAGATAALNAVLVNTSRAWSGAKYVIQTTPPPPPAEEGRVHADASGDPVAAGTFASPEDTAFAVLTLQHDVVTNGLALMDGKPTTPVGTLRTTIRSALNNRDAAINYIHSIAPPPPPAEEGRVHADASGDPIVATWDTVMPTLPLLIADEIQTLRGLHLRGATELKTLSRIRNERVLLNTYWPPVPVED